MPYQIGTISANYPDPVQVLVNTSMHVANGCDLFEDIDPEVLEKQLCESALDKFLGSGEMYWEDEEFIDNLNLATINTQIKSLKEHGLLDSIEDEKGEEIVWITEKGRALVKELKDSFEDNNQTP